MLADQRLELRLEVQLDPCGSDRVADQLVQLWVRTAVEAGLQRPITIAGHG